MFRDQYNRREFLRRAGLGTASAAALGTLGLPRPAPADDAMLAPFLHGIASGDPLSDRVILWTRITVPAGHDGRPVKVSWEIAEDLDFKRVVNHGKQTAGADGDWTVKVDADGLQPYRYYYYRFKALQQTSYIARTKTAPAGAETRHLRFGLVSCSNYTGGYFNAYARLSERPDLDAILHLGDYIYEYGNGEDRYGPAEMEGKRDHEPAHEQVSLEDYRLRHGTYKKDPDLRRLHQLFPFITTWDDHESTDNSYATGANNHQPDEGDWLVRKAASQRAYHEWMPIRPSGDQSVIYRTLKYGDLADFIVLDTRLEGRDRQLHYPGADAQGLGEHMPAGGEALAGLGLYAQADDPNRHLISPTQMAWMKKQFENSRAQWKILSQQVVVGQWNLGGLPKFPEGVPDAPMPIREGGNALNPDSWDGYQADRNELFKTIKNMDGFVVLTGDVHSSWAMDLTNDPHNPVYYDPTTGSGSLGVEFVAPAVSSPAFANTFGGESAGPMIENGMRVNNPHLKWVDSTHNGFCVLDVTPDGVQCDWYFVDTVLTPSEQEDHAASWRVNQGTKNLVAAQAAAPAKSSPEDQPAPDPSMRVSRNDQLTSTVAMAVFNGTSVPGSP